MKKLAQDLTSVRIHFAIAIGLLILGSPALGWAFPGPPGPPVSDGIGVSGGGGNGTVAEDGTFRTQIGLPAADNPSPFRNIPQLPYGPDQIQNILLTPALILNTQGIFGANLPGLNGSGYGHAEVGAGGQLLRIVGGEGGSFGGGPNPSPGGGSGGPGGPAKIDDSRDARNLSMDDMMRALQKTTASTIRLKKGVLAVAEKGPRGDGRVEILQAGQSASVEWAKSPEIRRGK